jgi:membrane fusion protein (multidrug efflux system)
MIRSFCLFPMTLIAGLLFVSGCDKPAADATPAVATVAKALPVAVQTVTLQDIVETFTLPGTLSAWEDLTLAAEVAGVVTWVGPQEGEAVAKGAALIAIDPETRKAILARDTVEADLTQKKMARQQQLVDEQLVSRQEFEDSVTAWERAKAALSLAQIELDKSTLRAPVSGVLDRRLVERGEYVKVGDPVALLVQVDRLKVEVDVPEKDVPYFKVGTGVQVVQASLPGHEPLRREGQLVHLAYKADPLTRTYRARIDIDNRDLSLRPGMIVRIEAVRRTLPQALAVPLYALVDRDGGKIALVVEAGQARVRPVTVEAIIGDQAVITAGLAAGEQLIIKGQQLAVDGTPVQVEGE